MNLIEDNRIATLIFDKGIKGVGVYYYLYNWLNNTDNKKIHFDTFKIIASRINVTERYVYDVATDYDLFDVVYQNQVISIID